MKVWLITVGEPLPTDAADARLLRAGILAQLMAKRGLDVTWWTGRFAHHLKRQRDELPASYVEAAGYRVELLEGRPYASNVSLTRILNHREQAADFLTRAAAKLRPDVILCSYPTIELSAAAVEFGRRAGVPVVLDVRDLWPDIFLDLAPAPLRPVARLALSGLFSASARALGSAHAIIGITDAFVGWGVKVAGRPASPLDQSFPMAYAAKQPPAEAIDAGHAFWESQGIRAGGRTICFFGTLGQWFDIPTVLAGARLLKDEDVDIVLCGDGDRLPEFREAARDLPRVRFPGWVDAGAIRSLMERSMAGLAPYRSVENFTMNLPNKPIEYLAGGLPVISSLRGELERLLAREACGLTYAESDPSDLARVVRSLASDPQGRQAMAHNARSVYVRDFVAESVYGRLTDYLLGMARDARQRAGELPAAA